MSTMTESIQYPGYSGYDPSSPTGSSIPSYTGTDYTATPDQSNNPSGTYNNSSSNYNSNSNYNQDAVVPYDYNASSSVTPYDPYPTTMTTYNNGSTNNGMVSQSDLAMKQRDALQKKHDRRMKRRGKMAVGAVGGVIVGGVVLGPVGVILGGVGGAAATRAVVKKREKAKDSRNNDQEARASMMMQSSAEFA